MPFFKSFKLIQFLFFVFYFGKGHSPRRKTRIFEKKQAKTTKTHFLKLKTGPIMLRNIVGLIFNFNLDQFLTLETCLFISFVSFFWRKPLFLECLQKNAKLKETQKGKRTLFVKTPVLTVLVKMFGFFCIFHFCCFWNFHVFRDSW